ncbi:Glutamate synthase [NADPH] large chain [hydrothermal vent metagenome]|uniref:Glutamate synthase [NADPH] large chain n=1 Tax=hydrothermal vent metagenome TaxID=652676 RepID=A0A3B1CLT8_9ZZZZ
MSYIKVTDPDPLTVGDMICVEAGGRQMALVRLDKGYFAIDNVCPHQQGSLCDGEVDLEKGEIICPMHGWNFEIETGVSSYNPKDKVKTFKVEERDDGVYIDISGEEKRPEPTDYLGQWRRREDEVETDMEMIHHMADGWVGPHGYTEPMRTARQESLWDKIVFLPGQLASPPKLDDYPVSTKTIIGRGAGLPIEISFPLYVSHMSFGALSREAKVALAKGSSSAGTLICSGEGGMLDDERDNAKKYILEMASGYFGWTDEAIARADGVEIKIGQAAKAGMGGMLSGKKVTGEIAKVRGLKPGQDAVSPSRFKDIPSLKEMKKRVREIRAKLGGKPLGMKIAAARIEADLAALLECEPDFITIDGRGGATGSAPKHVKDNIGVPTLYALMRAVEFLAKAGADVDIIVTGGLRLPSDFAKAVAMGATAVASATSTLIAIGCQQYRACHTGKCPVGITTQDPELRKRLDVDISAGKLATFFETTQNQLKDFTRICGKENVHDLSLEDLATTSADIAQYTGINHVGRSIHLRRP